MLTRKANIDQLNTDFEWIIPEHYNIGYDICDKWANISPDKPAITDIDDNGDAKQVTFGELKSASNQLANLLQSIGVEKDGNSVGDRVGVLLPQCVETAISHIAILKLGCVSIPLFTLFGEEALLHRLNDSQAKAIIIDTVGAEKIRQFSDRLPFLQAVISIDGASNNALDFHAECAKHSNQFEPVQTKADDAGILIYTSGTTGNPKGALHAHRVLFGHLPGVEISHNFLPQEGDKLWTPADWAWIGGLLDVMMPALHHGVPLIACRFKKFTAEAALELMRDYNVRNAFLPPTALKIMMQCEEAESYGLKLRSVGSGGETLGVELLEWGRRVFGTTINEFYGQTECNMVVSACSDLEEPRLGYMGRPVPGHRVEIIDPVSKTILGPNEEGEIGVLAPNPVMFIEYWKNPTATEEKFVQIGDAKWLRMGDRGTKDEGGRIHFLGRDDDVISSAGYRIGPAEIEDCLISHEAIQMAGAVGKPDDLRGTVVAAYVVLNPGYNASRTLAKEISEFVKKRLSAHEYPRVVRFLDEMPMTTTGKIVRKDLRAMAVAEAEALKAKK